MKQIRIGILLSILFIGCSPSDTREYVDGKIRERSSGEKSQTEKPRNEIMYGIEILTIDGCQYIKASDGFSTTISVSIIHKANCPNHRDTTEGK